MHLPLACDHHEYIRGSDGAVRDVLGRTEKRLYALTGVCIGKVHRILTGVVPGKGDNFIVKRMRTLISYWEIHTQKLVLVRGKDHDGVVTYFIIFSGVQTEFGTRTIQL